MDEHASLHTGPHHHHHHPTPRHSTPPHPTPHTPPPQEHEGSKLPTPVGRLALTLSLAGSHVGRSRRRELVSAPRADGGRDGCGGGKAPLLKGTEYRHSHQRGGGAGEEQRATATEGSTTGMRPALLAEPQGSQVVFQRQVAEQVHDAPAVPILADPVPFFLTGKESPANQDDTSRCIFSCLSGSRASNAEAVEKIAPPPPPSEKGVRWACLAIFFLDLGFGEFCDQVRLEPAFGGNRRWGFSGWSVQPKGLVRWRQPTFN